MQKRWWISFFSFFFILNVSGQDQQGDMQQLFSKLNVESSYNSVRKVKWMDTKSKNKLIAYNPVNVVFSSLMFEPKNIVKILVFYKNILLTVIQS